MSTDLVGINEIAERLQVKPRTVHQWRYRELLPPPTMVVSGTPLWQWGVVDQWAQSNGRGDSTFIPQKPAAAAENPANATPPKA